MIEKLFWPTVFLLIALGILVLELFLPSGGLLGVLAGTALLAAVIAAFVSGGTAVGIAFLAGTLLLVPVVIWALIKLWPKTPIGRRVILEPPRADELVPEQVSSLRRWVGRHGVAISPMLPSGAVEIEGTYLDAVSEGMPIEKGTPVRVVAAKANHLIVRPLPLDEAPNVTRHPAEPMLPDPFEDT